MHNFYFKKFFIAICAISLGSLGLAFFTQYVLGFAPCELCLYQRAPYVVLALISIAALILKKAEKLWIVIIMLAILSSIGLSGYHTLIERGVFKASTHCNPDINMPDNLSAEQIREQLYQRDVATCTKAPFKVMMLSMTEWNLVFNLILLTYLTYYLKKRAYAAS